MATIVSKLPSAQQFQPAYSDLPPGAVVVGSAQSAQNPQQPGERAPVDSFSSAEVEIEATSAEPRITENPRGEGIYQMRTLEGKMVDVPYSNVLERPQGWAFANQHERDRFNRDFQYAARQNPGEGGEAIEWARDGKIVTIQTADGEILHAERSPSA